MERKEAESSGLEQSIFSSPGNELDAARFILLDLEQQCR
jgi:hypothetical protein